MEAQCRIRIKTGRGEVKMNTNAELYHHGVMGQKWGVRRYQNKDGSLTLAGKRRALKMQDNYTRLTDNPKYRDRDGNLTYSGRKKALKMKEQYSQLTGKKLTRYPGVKKQNEQNKDVKKQNDQQKEKDPREIYEAQKQKAIKSGSAKEVLKFKGDLTPQEMQYIQNRINWEQNMQSISAKEVSKGKARAEKVFGAIDDITRYAGSAAKLWNTAANVYNAFSKKDVSLPKIDVDVTKGNRAIRKYEKQQAKEKQKDSKINNQNQNQSTNQNKNTNQNKKSNANDSWKKQTKIKWDTTVSDESINSNANKGKKWFVKNKTTKSKESDSEPITGTVEEEGTNKGSQSRKKNNDVIIDVVDYEPVSNLPAVRVSSGETYVNNRFLLEDRHR